MLTIPTTTATLGDITVNSRNEVSFNLINDTNIPIKVDSYSASCGCTSPSLSINPIPANSTAVFQLVFVPTSKGSHHKTGSIVVNGQTTTFYINATVK